MEKTLAADIIILRIRTKMENSCHIGVPGGSSFYGNFSERNDTPTVLKCDCYVGYINAHQ